MEGMEKAQNIEAPKGRIFTSVEELIDVADKIKGRGARIRIYGKKLEKSESNRGRERYTLVDDENSEIDTLWAFFRGDKNALRADTLDEKELKTPFRINERNIGNLRIDVF